MSLTPLTSGAVVGGPAAGSHTCGLPIESAGSRLPQAKIFPEGSRLMCSGTISQLTTGPHEPVDSSLDRGPIAIAVEVTVADPAANSMLFDPCPRIPRSPKAALPLAPVVAVVLPSRLPLPH